MSRKIDDDLNTQDFLSFIPNFERVEANALLELINFEMRSRV